MTIESISDTAHWVAMCRAIEGSRADALFQDTYASPLAGERGARILATIPAAKASAWAIAVRTAVVDEFVVNTIHKHGVNLVLDLASGLDTRAWRLDLPRDVTWIDVDLPHVLSHKAEVMDGHEPRCRYETVATDLRDLSARRELFAQVAARSANALVITEGLLIYLNEDEVSAMARDLHHQPAFRWWIVDLVSPALLTLMNVVWGRTLDRAKAPFQFAPVESTRFFREHGWHEAEYRGAVDEAHRLRRGTPFVSVLWLLGRHFRAQHEAIQRLTGVALLRRPTK